MMNKIIHLRITFLFQMCVRKYCFKTIVEPYSVYLSDQNTDRKIKINSLEDQNISFKYIKLTNGEILTTNGHKLTIEDEILSVKSLNIKNEKLAAKNHELANKHETKTTRGSNELMSKGRNLTKETIESNGATCNISASLEERDCLSSLLEENKIEEAFDLFKNLAIQKRYLKFHQLKKLSFKMSIKCGNLSNVRYIINCVALIYPQKYFSYFELNHHLAASLFNSGLEDESLRLLKNMMSKYPRQREIVDVICNIMSILSQKSERTQLQFSEWSCSLCKEHNLYEPAFVLWATLFKSKKHFQNKLAARILNNYPRILRETSSCKLVNLKTMVNDACFESDVELLQKIIQVVLRYQYVFELKKVLEEAMSALLTDYCISENCMAADEVFSYSQLENVSLSHTSLSLYSRFLSSLNRPTPLSILASKDGGHEDQFSPTNRERKKRILDIKKIIQSKPVVGKPPTYKF